MPAKLGEGGVVERGPMKMHDDFGNALMMLVHDKAALQAAPLTGAERVAAMMPADLQPERIAQVENPDERARRVVAAMMQRRRVEHELSRPRGGRRDPLRALREMGKSRR